MNADSSEPEQGPISRDLIKETLRTLEVRFLIDGDGDVITLWPDSCMCFLTAGTGSTMYVHQVHPDRRFALDNRPYLLEHINDWNRAHYWPNAFAVTDDMGEVRVHAESQFDCTAGITPRVAHPHHRMPDRHRPPVRGMDQPASLNGIKKDGPGLPREGRRRSGGDHDG